jgi:hypothetical protein
MHSFVGGLRHCVFATRERRPLITPELQHAFGRILVVLRVKTE